MDRITVNLDPIIFSLGPLQVRWYGLMYVIGFIIAGFLLRRLSKKGFFQVPLDKIDNFITLLLICMFVGARLAYVFIYNWGYYQDHLSELLAVWQGGLSFHGALAGLLVGGYIYARRNGISWAQVMDNVALAGSPGLFFGRMGNFINGELYGRITDHPIGMIFPQGGPYPRHPSQLYEGILEGVVLTAILWILLPRVRKLGYGYLASLFLIFYGVFRYIVEFFRAPDPQLGYYFAGTTTMGQILCLIMIALGGFALYLTHKKQLKY